MLTSIPVAFIGPSSTGKTALIHSALNNQTEIFPTAGVEINHITSTSRALLAYDCSGEGSSRANWSLFASLAEAVVYVIDAHNPEGFVWAKKHLYSFLEQHKFMR